jgi:hypothetical protein
MSNVFSQARPHTSINVVPSVLKDGLVRGNIYAISIQSAPTGLSLIRHALSINHAHGIHCTLITQLLPEECFARFENAKANLLLRSIQSGALSVFSMIGDYSNNIFRFGPERFLHELEFFHIPDDGLLLMDQADSLFTVEDYVVAASQARTYRQWMRKTRNVALFLFLHNAGSGRTSASYQTVPVLRRWKKNKLIFRRLSCRRDCRNPQQTCEIRLWSPPIRGRRPQIEMDTIRRRSSCGIEDIRQQSVPQCGTRKQIIELRVANQRERKIEPGAAALGMPGQRCHCSYQRLGMLTAPL